MSLDQLEQSVVQDTPGGAASLAAFRPELTLVATILAVLLARTFVPRWTAAAFQLTFLGLMVATFGFAFPWGWLSAGIPPAAPIFTGALLSDSFTVATAFPAAIVCQPLRHLHPGGRRTTGTT